MSAAMRCLVLVMGLAWATAQSFASTRVAVYAIVDEIEFEPSSFEPERAWISGVFVVPVPMSSGLHAAPKRGHLYLSLSVSDSASTRGDWEALQANAGTGRVVGFGEYWMPCSRSRSAGAGFPMSADSNCSAEVIVLETDRTRATPAPHPTPSSEGVVTVFDHDDDVCPRFGRPSVQIVADLSEAHTPGRDREEPPVCTERIGLIDSSELASAFVVQGRDAEWADATEPLILDRFANASGLRLSDLRVECRDTICRVHAAFPTQEYRETVGNRLVATALHELPGFAPGAKIDRPRSAPTVDYYLQRRKPR